MKLDRQFRDFSTKLRARFFPAHRIAFVHLAKCGGTSVSEAILQKYRYWALFSPTSIQRFDRTASLSASGLTGVDNDLLRRVLLAYDISKPESRLLLGHYRYSRETHLNNQKKWSFVTMLRHPVERWLSHYYYNSERNRVYAINLPLEDFLRTDRGRHLGAFYVRYFAECPPGELEDSQASINKAIEVLKSFDLVGQMENMREFELSFHKRFGSKLDVPLLNQGRHPRRRSTLSPGVQDLIREQCQPDIQVYEALFGTS